MENNEKIGIYQILNTSNGKSYIGQSKNIKNREYQHFSKIKIKKHENKKIMLDINDNFVFNVLKECDYEDLDYYEWFYIKMYNSIKKMAKQQQHNYYLDANTIVKVIAYHKFSDEEFEQKMTFGKWIEFKKSKNYFYKCLQV
jgi:hypothetical protein